MSKHSPEHSLPSRETRTPRLNRKREYQKTIYSIAAILCHFMLEDIFYMETLLCILITAGHGWHERTCHQVTDDGVSDPRGGTLFKLTPSGKFTKLFTFTQGSSGFLNGNNPADGFVEANDGFLYGTTFNGGKQNDGVPSGLAKRALVSRFSITSAHPQIAPTAVFPTASCWDRTATFTGPHRMADHRPPRAQAPAAARSSVSSRRPALLPFSIN
jgi:hypothetical protein